MPLAESYANEATTTLNGAIADDAATLTPTSGAGFPAAPFRIRVSGALAGGGTGTEYMLVTATGGSWSVTRGVEAPYDTGLAFADGATIEHVLTVGGLYAAGPYLNAKAFGAKGDGSTDDGAAINAAITEAAGLGVAGGATVFLPPGSYAHSVSVAHRSNVRLLGAGREATRLVRTADVPAVTVYGTESGDSGRCFYAALEHLTIDGGDMGATGLDLVYASQFMCRDVFIYNVKGISLDCVEVWDSAFTDVFIQWAAGQAVAEQPALYVRCSRAESGFGLGTDSSNELRFTNLHIEHFRSGAIRVAPGLGATGGPNGIYFRGVKTESPFVSNTTPLIYIDANTSRVHVSNVYAFVADLLDGGPVPAIQNNSDGMTSLRNVYVGNADVETLVSAVNIGIGSSGQCVVSGVYGDYATAPQVAHINVTDASAQLRVEDIHTNAGELIAGFEPDTPQRARKVTTPVTTTATSVTDLAELMFDHVQPGEYVLDLWAVYQSSSTSVGPRFGVGGTATLSAGTGAVTMHTSTTAATTEVIAAPDAGVGANPEAADTDLVVVGRFPVTVSAAGSVGVRWLMSGAGTGTVQAGSYALLTRTR